MQNQEAIIVILVGESLIVNFVRSEELIVLHKIGELDMNIWYQIPVNRYISVSRKKKLENKNQIRLQQN